MLKTPHFPTEHRAARAFRTWNNSKLEEKTKTYLCPQCICDLWFRNLQKSNEPAHNEQFWIVWVFYVNSADTVEGWSSVGTDSLAMTYFVLGCRCSGASYCQMSFLTDLFLLNVGNTISRKGKFQNPNSTWRFCLQETVRRNSFLCTLFIRICFVRQFPLTCANDEGLFCCVDRARHNSLARIARRSEADSSYAGDWPAGGFRWTWTRINPIEVLWKSSIVSLMLNWTFSSKFAWMKDFHLMLFDRIKRDRPGRKKCCLNEKFRVVFTFIYCADSWVKLRGRFLLFSCLVLDSLEPFVSLPISGLFDCQGHLVQNVRVLMHWRLQMANVEFGDGHFDVIHFLFRSGGVTAVCAGNGWMCVRIQEVARVALCFRWKSRRQAVTWPSCEPETRCVHQTSARKWRR